ncbi:BTAD domain-containing putative transcriptional regulator [Pseudonocardia yuanmonensis]|uniref:BTAD domain-containing putative transcriptional regulator n=1 Tax=Pseudonocardia yuanmonensis TaxID=1095914 RepID=UPI0031E5EBC8
MTGVDGTVEVGVLGPLRLVVGGTEVPVPGPKRRAVLALLALAEGRAVTVDHLLDAVWPAEVPESGRAALHSHVSRLRGTLGPAADRLATLEGAYRLDLGPDALDTARARRLLAGSREAEAPAAIAALREADALWRGPVLADLLGVEPVAASVVALDELRRAVSDELVHRCVEAGRAAEVLDRAAAAVAAEPLREAAVRLLVRALAAVGRTTDALAAAREHRRLLAEETGLDPSAALGELERAVASGELGAEVPRPVRRAAVPPTPLVGREASLAAVRALVGTERLVTLVGPGGVGKTRLAREVAGDGPTVLLAPVTDPAAVPHALAAAFSVRVTRGDVLSACVAVLAPERGVVLLDNCEHVLDAARDVVAALLDGCPGLTVLATSRTPLGLPAETVHRLGPLQLPLGGAGDLRAVPAVAVFLDRAARARPGFTAGPADLDVVAEIVRRLDGVPLAIELAAGRLSVLGLADLRDRLDRALDLLGGGRPSADARHRTLRATVDWSYALLPPAEQRLFRHLAVFADGVDLGTAERLAEEITESAAITEGDAGGGADPAVALAHLADASVLEVDFGGGTRYRMLETLRAYGLDRLAAEGETEEAAARLLRWAVDLVRAVDAGIATEREPEADAALRRELGNLRAAWRLARERGDLDTAVELVVGLEDVAGWRGLSELQGWGVELATDPVLTGHPRAGEVTGTAAMAAYHRGDHAQADALGRAALAAGSAPRAAALGHSARQLAALSRAAYDEVLEHGAAAAAVSARPFLNLGVAALAAAYAGDLARARDLRDRTAATAGSPTGRGFAEYVTGEIANAAGDVDAAEPHYLAALDLARAAGSTFLTGIASVGLLSARAAAGRVADALRGYREVVDHWAATGTWTQLWVTLRNLADLLRLLDDPGPAALLDAAADAAPDAPPRPAAVPASEPRAAPSSEPKAAPSSEPRAAPSSEPRAVPSARPGVGSSAGPGRAEALAVARRAVAEHLARGAPVRPGPRAPGAAGRGRPPGPA